MRGYDAGVRAAVVTLHADAVAKEAVVAFTARGIPCLLLRGRALDRVHAGRTYGDVDLLVPPARLHDAEEVLVDLGFAPATTDSDFPVRGAQHANEWRRSSDGASIDLHRTVSGATVSDETVWQALSERSETLELSGLGIRCPDASALALLVALHAAHHGQLARKPLRDLRGALDTLPAAEWREAATLARQLDALPAFAAGLRLDTGGAELAASLGLPDSAPADVQLRAAGAPPPALGLLGLLEARDRRTQARLLLRGLAPSPAALRHGRRLARRGKPGLAAAYFTQPLWLLRYLGPSAAAVRRARKEAR